MIGARLQYGPFDGQTGSVVVPPPLALDVTRCRGCGCGRPVHYKVAAIEEVAELSYVRYELIAIEDGGVALYRHAETLDPITEQLIAETVCG